MTVSYLEFSVFLAQIWLYETSNDNRFSVSVCLSVCLFVCPLAYLKNRMAKFHQIFYTCYMLPRQCVMYFRLCG